MAADPLGASAVVRFVPTERKVHMIHAVAFSVMLFTGLVLYMPSFALMFGNRPVIKAIHLVAATAWLTALAVVFLLGDRRALRRTRRDIECFDDDDLLWLRRRHTPQGRFNAGQKLHAIVQAALSVLFVVSGALLWLGERNTALRLPGTIALHDVCMYVAVVLVLGHLWMAIQPDNGPARWAIMHGPVPAAWAAAHHPKWQPEGSAAPRGPGAIAVALAVLTVALGATGAVLLARDATVGNARPPAAALPTAKT